MSDDMDTEGSIFAFDENNSTTLSLFPIEEESEEETDTGDFVEKGASGGSSGPGLSTAALMAEVEDDMGEMRKLISQLKTGTSTRLEKDKLAALRSKMSAKIREVSESKTKQGHT
jgi:hypothetical protein